MWKSIRQMSETLIVLLICVCVNECSNVNGHSEPTGMFLSATNNGYRRTVRTGQYAGDPSNEHYQSPSVLGFPSSLNDLQQSNENEVRTITVQESSFSSFTTTAATPTDQLTKWNGSEESPVVSDPGQRGVAAGRNYGKQSYVVETIPSVFLPSNLSSVSLLINRILLSDEIPKPVPFSSYHSEEETMQTSDTVPPTPAKRPTINVLKTVTSVLRVSNATSSMGGNMSTAPQPPNKLKLFSSYVESTGNSPLSPTSTGTGAYHHTTTQSQSQPQPVPYDSPNERLVASNSIGYGASALSAFYQNRQRDKGSASNISKQTPSSTTYTPTTSVQMKYSPNPYHQQYSLTQPINSYENLQLTEDSSSEPEILTALPEFYSSINGLGASAPSGLDATVVGIVPSTSYSLPGFSSQVRKESSHFPKDANKNAASDLITGASTVPFSLPKEFTQVTNEYERHGKPKGILNQFSKNTVSEMSSEMQQELSDKYEFNYMVNDGVDTQFSHKEARNGNSTHGSYVVILPDGRKQVVDYEANNSGFYPKVRYEGSALKENEKTGRNSVNTYRGFNQKFLYPYVSNLRYNRKLNRGYTSGPGTTQNSPV